MYTQSFLVQNIDRNMRPVSGLLHNHIDVTSIQKSNQETNELKFEQKI